ncbi:TIGR02186 family protein [Aliiroseovarius crassostreae]|uniref:TIGR02186 family protein n=1 Tax=Aliiroseovarius crassostreae TaxID=154981 RepID=A0A9Q9LWL2_9RHOB|nr:TIGR02186 family protein [Aliiroseovarius crassostreae]UWP88334.1 TIGR02186 family protein [Aliiroseovarius crassostreae]UWP91510.1 TIGR02186 family protein [Aliiroseovarius crassostreae]UWP94667.1 TIGR02186 family protein [Aliiroseovarius crassostreae]UWQ00994.1 TIGR02186 family protein [Aliiroseovarius crassostreae]
MRRFLAPLFALICAALPVQAKEDIVAGLSQNMVSINATFVGSEILIFGAVKRESPAPTDEPLEVVVVVEGPNHPVTVRKKDKRFGIWVNTDALEIASAPSFYAVSTSSTLDGSISILDDLRHLVSVHRAIQISESPFTIEDPTEFTQALIRIRENKGTYRLLENNVTVREDTLFDTRIALPSNLTEGQYRTRILLTRGGYVAASYETVINVQKVGLERWIFNLARNQPLIYGLLSLFIAIVAGWGASSIFRFIQRG